MAYEQKPGQFVLFKNDKDGNEKRPDYTGSINLDGNDYQLSAWIKTSKSNTKFMSLSVQPKKAPVSAPEPALVDDFDDEVPF